MNRVVRLLVAFIIVAVAAACGSSPSTPSTPAVTPTITTLPPLAEMVAEKTIGSATARNTVIVYSSFTCSHCADFHMQSFPQLKSQYIDAGTVRFVFRDWERNAPDIRAAMLARCAGDGHYFDAVEMLFRNQSSWASASDPNGALANLMRQFGMAQSVIDACVASTALSDAIVASHNDGTSRYGVRGTPTFVVNDSNIVEGNQGLPALVKYFP